MDGSRLPSGEDDLSADLSRLFLECAEEFLRLLEGLSGLRLAESLYRFLALSFDSSLSLPDRSLYFRDGGRSSPPEVTLFLRGGLCDW